MIPEIENAGLSFVGKDGTGRRMEVICSYKPCLMCSFSESLEEQCMNSFRV